MFPARNYSRPLSEWRGSRWRGGSRRYLTKWYEEHGRHEIFAGGKKVKMEDETHSLLLRENIVTTELQHDLDKLGIAKNAREEKKRARDAKAALSVDHSENPVP